MTRIKLCGLSRPEDIASANRVQPEFVGFVFVPGSKRYVSGLKSVALVPTVMSSSKAQRTTS